MSNVSYMKEDEILSNTKNQPSFRFLIYTHDGHVIALIKDLKDLERVRFFVESEI